MRKMGREKVLESLHSRYELLEEMLAQLSDEEMTRPGVQARWSVKDIVAHLTAWDQRGIRWISAALQGEIPFIPEPGYSWTGRHKLNEQTYQENLALPVDVVLRNYRDTFSQLLELLEDMSLIEWNRMTPVVHKSGAGKPVMIGELVRWRLQHLVSHSKPIEKWLAEGRGT